MANGKPLRAIKPTTVTRCLRERSLLQRTPLAGVPPMVPGSRSLLSIRKSLKSGRLTRIRRVRSQPRRSVALTLRTNLALRRHYVLTPVARPEPTPRLTSAPQPTTTHKPGRFSAILALVAGLLSSTVGLMFAAFTLLSLPLSIFCDAPHRLVLVWRYHWRLAVFVPSGRGPTWLSRSCYNGCLLSLGSKIRLATSRLSICANAQRLDPIRQIRQRIRVLQG